MDGSDATRFPVSFAQQRLWFLDRLSPGSSLYLVPVTLRLTTAIDAEVLRRSLNEIVRRHETLRTTFEAVDGAPQQVVHPRLDLELPVVDLQDVPAAQREATLADRSAAEAVRPLDLARGPLLRATLYRLGPQDHLLLLVLHHIAADGWSLGLIVSELTAIYPAFVQGLPSPLPSLPIQYADYAVWQRQRLADHALDGERAYWRDQLAGLPPFTLPLPGPSAASPEPRPSRLAMTLPPDTAAKLAALGRHEGATLFMTLVAGFEALLHRYSGEGDFGIGTVVANRTRAETEALVGCFVNTLVLRARIAGADTFRELLGRVRETTLAGYAHQELPFERLVEELRPTRVAGRNPLVQVLLTLQNTPAVARHASDDLRAGWELDRGSASFDLTVDLWQTSDGLESRWEYRADLFDGEAVAGLARHYRHLLEALAEQPDRPIDTLALMDPAERHALLQQGEGPHADRPADALHRGIARVASRQPDRLAAASPTQTLTYGQLQASADRLAEELRRRGAGPGGLVGIVLQRSPWWGVAMLGVLGAGAAFLAIDPCDPAPRRASLLDDAGARVLVTDSALAPRIEVGDRELICVDLLDGSPHTQAPGSSADPRPEPVVPPDTPAYLVYTSGSTGSPKGVLVGHGALANHGHGVVERYALSGHDRVLQLAPVAFDVALEELLASWLAGAAVHFPTTEGALSFPELHRHVERDRITVLNLPASYWHEWVDHLARTGERVPAGLRLVVCGSERVSTAKLRAWQRLAGPRVRWINAYGVTEATITSTTYEPDGPVPDDAPDVVPIGRPLANVRTLVLDGAGAPVPHGVAGELHIGGAGVALGYLGRPDLSAASFVAAPADSGGGRLYKTGDLVRYSRSGDLEYLGRRDAQVKVRGYRVELAEVEAALLAHPEVREAVVLPRGDGDGLIAYVVASREQPALRAFLGARLPGHLVPETYVPLPDLPRTPRGKIDRAALPLPARAPVEQHRVTPSSPLEARLADLWASVLGLPHVSVTDSFFDLGGHSLLATQLLSRVQADLGVEVPLRTLFDSPTVAGLAAAMGTEAPAAPPGGPQGTTSVATGGPRDADLTALDVDRLSDAEVDALLAQLLADGEA